MWDEDYEVKLRMGMWLMERNEKKWRDGMQTMKLRDEHKHQQRHLYQD